MRDSETMHTLAPQFSVLGTYFHFRSYTSSQARSSTKTSDMTQDRKSEKSVKHPSRDESYQGDDYEKLFSHAFQTQKLNSDSLRGKFFEIMALRTELLKRDSSSWLINTLHAGKPLFSACVAGPRLCTHMKDTHLHVHCYKQQRLMCSKQRMNLVK